MQCQIYTTINYKTQVKHKTVIFSSENFHDNKIVYLWHLICYKYDLRSNLNDSINFLLHISYAFAANFRVQYVEAVRL